MGRKPKWTTTQAKDGYGIYELSSWKQFHDFITQEMLKYSHYVWRGHRDSKWSLKSSLDRKLQFAPIIDRSEIAKEHLRRFMYASRGRRGFISPKDLEENEWWALGQEHGLATPLLDWTESPFVALYFAFEKAEKPSSGFRSVWALCPVPEVNERITREHIGGGRPPILEMVRPLQENNARLVSQNGLFTRAPIGVGIKQWIIEHFTNSDDEVLLQLRIPDRDRGDCLRTLHKMNINHITLFPDLYGAAKHCTRALEIKGI